MKYLKFIVLIAITLVSGCTSLEFPYSETEADALRQEIIGHPRPLPEAPTLWLSDEVKAILDERIPGHYADKSKLNRLREFLFDENELGIRYSADDTKTAMEIWESRKGNCLSLANFFIAAARYVGIDAHYMTVQIRPTWDLEGATMIRYQHVVTSGRLSDGDDYVVDFLPEFVIGGRRSEEISDEEALVLYFNNRGAEDFVHGHYEAAIENLREALTLDSDFSDGWNTMAAALRRSNQPELAEFAYRQALAYDANNLSAMNNLAQFFKSQGRSQESEAFMNRVRKYRDRNPYFHYFIAENFYKTGEYERALVMLGRCIELKEDEPDFYTAMARTYEQLGNDEEQLNYLALAEKYKAEDGLREVPRIRDHRIWFRTYRVN